MNMVVPGFMAFVVMGVQLVLVFGVVYLAARLAIRHERRTSN